MFDRCLLQPAGQSAVEWSRALFDQLFLASPSGEPSKSLTPVFVELGKRLLSQESDAEKAKAADHITPTFLRLLDRAPSDVAKELLSFFPLLVDANPSVFSSYCVPYILAALKDVQNRYQSDVLQVVASFSKLPIASEVFQCLRTQIQCLVEDYLKGPIPDLSLLKRVFARLQYYATQYPNLIECIVGELTSCEEKLTSQMLSEIATHQQDEFFEASAIASRV